MNINIMRSLRENALETQLIITQKSLPARQGFQPENFTKSRPVVGYKGQKIQNITVVTCPDLCFQ